MADTIGESDFTGHRWSVRTECLSVVGNLGTHSDGTPYLYLALDLGPLYYYPAMLSEAFILGYGDSCYEDLEALRTVNRHHVSLLYLPAVSDITLVFLAAQIQRHTAEVDGDED